ncbi:MAG: hypothetical protein WC310_05785 [Patescibacteria group bacterium]|jgi:hypothetical protein
MELTLPATAISDVSTYITGILTTYWPLIAIVLGIFLGFFIIERVVSTISPKDFKPWEKRE